MKTAVKIPWLLILAALTALLVAVILLIRPQRAARTPRDRHAGQVYLYDGYDWTWLTPLEGVPVNPMSINDFTLRDGVPEYLGDKYRVLRGVDLSEHQGQVDWSKLASAGLDYAYIRVGRRGYSEGGLFDDPYFKRNMDGARKHGIDVGVYFFSQAISVQEALEEADFLLKRLEGYELRYPVVFDWEIIEGVEDARTRDLSPQALTDCAVAFCERVKNAGYSPAVYFNRRVGYYHLDLSRLTDYQFWFALPESPFPNFYYAVDMWQYSFSETLPGVNTQADMNLMFLPLEESA